MYGICICMCSCVCVHMFMAMSTMCGCVFYHSPPYFLRPSLFLNLGLACCFSLWSPRSLPFSIPQALSSEITDIQCHALVIWGDEVSGLRFPYLCSKHNFIHCLPRRARVVVSEQISWSGKLSFGFSGTRCL